MNLPKVMSEAATLEAAIAGRSLARFGDGELKLALGKDCVSQARDKSLAHELRAILKGEAGGALVAIPNYRGTPRKDVWDRYGTTDYARLFGAGPYGSSFITRPDNAPWIDAPAYWARVKDLWRGREVTLVAGSDRSLRAEDLAGAHAVRVVEGPRRDAWAEVARIEAEIGTPEGIVLLCLGATATVLAARLAAKGIHAVDLGHVGMFMRHAGAYAYQPDELASPQYRKLLRAKHAEKRWGKDGHSHAPEVTVFADALGAESILDYGCGRGTLAEALKPRRVMEYDPGVEGKDKPPKPADLVVSTDVLEHIEPALLDGVLGHLSRLAGKGCYLVIATTPAREILADGRNAHLIVQPPAWWLEQLARFDWTVERSEARKGFHVWLRK